MLFRSALLAPPRNQSRPCTRLRTARPAISKRSRLRSGTPTAHERNALPLHPSGPGGIRRGSLRGAQPSTPSREAHSTRTALEREFNPAVADCGLQGTATSPSSTARLSPIADKDPFASLAPSTAGSTYREYASPAVFGRRLATGPFSPIGMLCGISESPRYDSLQNLWRRSKISGTSKYGGGGGIRTHGTVARTRHFQCRTFGHSATPPTQVNHFTRRLPDPGAPEPCAGASRCEI